MSLEVEGALNRLTAATLTAATTIERAVGDDTNDEGEARRRTEDRFEDHLDFLLEM